MPSTITRSLHDTFGLARLRPGQAEVIRAVLNGEDILALMPTGAGKSLCYQLPALQLAGMTVIVSPLIALMKDQVDKLKHRGLEAVELNSSVPQKRQAEALHEIVEQKSDFVFTTPERLAMPDFLETLRETEIDFVVIDEAHCISQWGHDFRPSYLAIQQALRELDDPPVLALTATATEEVLADIRTQLGRPNMRVVNTGIYRPNLEFRVEHVKGDDEKHAVLLKLLAETPGTGIIYTATIRHVNDVAAFLETQGIAVATYDGQEPTRHRTDAQERFMAGDIRALVATNAFGLGIDKPDIRFIVHYDLPGSLEAYYQEAGRSGRDGEPARCTLLYDRSDRRVQLLFLGGKYPDADDVRAVHDALKGGGEGRQTRGGGGGTGLSELQEQVPQVGKKKTRVVLSLLKEAGLVRERRGARFMLRRGAEPGELERLALAYRERKERDREKLEQVDAYAKRAKCRWRLLHEYFGEELPVERCGTCDNCRRGL